MALMARKTKQMAVGLSYVLPNMLGFLCFTTIPLVFSMVLAFTNWDLKRHNQFKPDEAIRFIGLDNFQRLLNHPDFYHYLGNTLYLMLAMPIGIAASLMTAMLLNKDTKAGGGKGHVMLISTALTVAGISLLMAIGLQGTAMTLLLVSVASMVLVVGISGGLTIYRTLFYVPSFTSGVATFILWKKLYNPNNGPINRTLDPMLEKLTRSSVDAPAWLFQVGSWAAMILLILVLLMALRRLRLWWAEGDLGTAGAILPVLFLLTPLIVGVQWSAIDQMRLPLGIATAIVLLWQGFMTFSRTKEFTAATAGEGFGNATMFCAGAMVLEFIMLGMMPLVANLQSMALSPGGLQPPQWLASYDWAKPSIMLMGLWAAVGSNTMLLYLAALTNVPAELYEAADIDGAGPFGRFWHVTWPQLAPTTFFVVVMGIISGLQGGFETARVLTQGGPAGSTTTLSYFIYSEGFETGRLGYSSAVGWTLFLMVFSMTVFNWKFGNRYVND